MGFITVHDLSQQIAGLFIMISIHQTTRNISFWSLILTSQLGLIAAALQCKFKIEQHSFDLCPLIFTSMDSSSDTLKSRHICAHYYLPEAADGITKRITYDMDLGGKGLPLNPERNAEEQVCSFPSSGDGFVRLIAIFSVHQAPGSVKQVKIRNLCMASKLTSISFDHECK